MCGIAAVVEFKGAQLAYQLQGPPDAPPLLLLQGQANSHRWWERLREPFAAHFRTITFDYRGSGDTQAPPDAWTTASFAADAMAVLDHLGVHAACVYGTSMGGRVAQLLGPERVRKLVLACTTAGGPHARERGQDVRRLLAQPDPRARRQALLDLMYTPHFAGRERSTLLGDPTMTPDAQRRHLRVSASHDAYDLLPRITAPTLILHGADDLMAPAENAQIIAGRIPDARIRITPNGRHGFFDEFAETVTRDVLDFLA